MGYGYVVMFALGPLLCQISAKDWIVVQTYGEDRTEVYVVPFEDFSKWLEQEPNIPPAGWKLYESIYDAKKAEKEK